MEDEGGPREDGQQATSQPAPIPLFGARADGAIFQGKVAAGIVAQVLAPAKQRRPSSKLTPKNKEKKLCKA